MRGGGGSTVVTFRCVIAWIVILWILRVGKCLQTTTLAWVRECALCSLPSVGGGAAKRFEGVIANAARSAGWFTQMFTNQHATHGVDVANLIKKLTVELAKCDICVNAIWRSIFRRWRKKFLELVDLRRHPARYMHPFFDRIASAGGSPCSL